jgi:hypothetical protein
MSDNNEQPKKRGRPRKNNESEVKIVEKPKMKVDNNEEEELILHLNIPMAGESKQSSESEKNRFTTKDEFDENSESEFSENDETMLSITNSDESSSESTNNKKKFTDEIREKDKIIKKLKDDINQLLIKQGKRNTTKQTRFKVIDLKLFSIKDNKQILNDTTDIACWHCCHQFDNTPWFLPEKYQDNKYFVLGCFCSPNCALAYNILLNDSKTNERNSLLKNLYILITGSCSDITVAPSKECLELFGGYVSIEKYRESFYTDDREYKVHMPPFVPINVYVEEKSADFEHVETNKFAANDGVTLNKRVKPQQKATLFDTMGLAVKK